MQRLGRGLVTGEQSMGAIIKIKFNRYTEWFRYFEARWTIEIRVSLANIEIWNVTLGR